MRSLPVRHPPRQVGVERVPEPGLARDHRDQLDLGAGQVDRRRQAPAGSGRRGSPGRPRPSARRRPAPRRSTACPRGARSPSAVDALPCGSLSRTSTLSPACASAAARFTVVVVLPTPPFWFATVITRVLGGRGNRRPRSSIRRRASCCSCAMSGVSSDASGRLSTSAARRVSSGSRSCRGAMGEIVSRSRSTSEPPRPSAPGESTVRSASDDAMAAPVSGEVPSSER